MKVSKDNVKNIMHLQKYETMILDKKKDDLKSNKIGPNLAALIDMEK